MYLLLLLLLLAAVNSLAATFGAICCLGNSFLKREIFQTINNIKILLEVCCLIASGCAKKKIKIENI